MAASGRRSAFFADQSADAKFSRATEFQIRASTSVGPVLAMSMAADISAKVVKELRDKTGAGMMECKKALLQTNGSMEEAVEILRKKGVVSAQKKADRDAKDGVITAYLHHNNRLGVLIEVNCETDFVARRVEFRELVDNIAMQIAASPNIEFIKRDEIPQDTIENERRIEMGRDDLASKPEAVRAKIVEGRIDKMFGEQCLLEQPYILDPTITVEEYIQRAIVLTGENIQVRRFTRYALGEN